MNNFITKAKSYFLALTVIVTFSPLYGQNISNGNSTGCSGTFYDSGGAGSNYGDDENFTFTLCADPGFIVEVDFTSFETYSGLDYLSIYNGDNVNAPSMGVYSGTNSPGTVLGNNPTGCVTFVWVSNDPQGNQTTTAAGWEAAISCVPGCQTVIASLTSSITEEVCLGDNFSVNGTATFPNNNDGYTQTIGSSTFEWDFADGTDGAGQNVNHSYSEPGIYNVNLTVTDVNGCSSTNDINLNVYVSDEALFAGTAAANTSICLGEQNTLTGVVVSPEIFVICSAPSGEETFLPDGTGQAYETVTSVDCFDTGQTLPSGIQIEDICLDLEHSYAGDLVISIICPNGQTMELMNGTGNGIFGEPIAQGLPIDDNTGNENPGIGYTYCFSPTATNGVPEDNNVLLASYTDGEGNISGAINQVPAGTYEASGDWSDLDGCPLNGDWTISVQDVLSSDNGTVFEWNINFPTSLVPVTGSYTPSIDTEAWNADATIVSTSGTSITVEPTSTGNHCYTYAAVDEYGCPFDTTVCFMVTPAPVVNSITPVFACDSYTLPAISGTDLTGNQAYYTGAGGTGTTYAIGASITTTTTLYAYDALPAPSTCFDEEMFVVTIDNTPPVINCPGNLTGNCSITEHPAYADLAAFTAAGGSASDETNLNVASFTLLSETSTGTCPIVYTRTYQIADACGHLSTCVQTVTIDDTQNPTGSAPADDAYECLSDVPAQTIAQITGVTDNCTAAPVVAMLAETQSGTCPITITRQWSITDDCLNSITVTQVITVEDTQNPTWTTAPGALDGTFECSDAAGIAAAQADFPVATDNCDTDVTNIVEVVGAFVAGTCPEDGTYTNTWTVTDECGNISAVYTQVITIEDNTDPTASDPATTSVPAGSVPPVDPSVVIDEMDNCTVNPTVTFISESTDNGVCPETITRIYEVEDDCGNTIQVTHLILVGDAIFPTASNPVDINVECLSDVPVPDEAVVTDETDNGATPIVTFEDDNMGGGVCPDTLLRRYRVTDDCGNFMFVTQNIIIEPVTNPVVPVNGAELVSCVADADGSGIVLPAVTDVCGNALVASAPMIVDAPDPITCEGARTYTYTFTDCAGNTTDWSYVYTIDNVTPIAAPIDAASTVTCPSDAVDPGAPADILDACGQTVTPVLVGSVDTPNPLTCEGTRVWTYSYTDCSGNTDTWTHTYTIDNVTPIATPIDAVSTVTCPADAVDPGAPADILDACGQTVTPVLVGSVDTPDPLTCEGTRVWTYSYTDCSGNTDTWTHTYTIDNTTALTAPLDAASNVTCPADAIDPGAPADIIDACGQTVTPVLVGSSDTPDPVQCSGTRVWTYSYTDCSGNTVNWTHTYTIDNTTPLAPPVNGASTVSCIADAIDLGTPGDILDACGTAITPVLIGSVDTPDPLTCEGTRVFTYEYTDCAGNVFPWMYTYTIDNVTPIAAPIDATSTVTCPSDAVDPGAPADILDACGQTVTPVLVGSVDTPNPLTCEGTRVWTYSYTDCSGNTDTWTHTYTIDLPAFTLPFADDASTVNCLVDGQVEPTPPSAVVDLCGNIIVPVVTTPADIVCEGDMAWIFNYTDCGGNTLDWTYTYTIDLPVFTLPFADDASTVNCLVDAQVEPTPPSAVVDLCGNTIVPVVTTPADIVCEGDMAWIFTYTDCGGNTLDWTYTYTIDIPAFTLPFADDASTVNCLVDGQVEPTPPSIVFDLCGNTIVPVVTTPADIVCEGDMAWIFTYTDCGGNTLDWTYTYTIDLPAFTLPFADDASTVNCLVDGQVEPTPPSAVVDLCGNTIVPVVTTPADIVCEGDMAWIFTYTDCAGNTLDWTYTYTIDLPAVLMPVDDFQLIECLVSAVEPAAPVVVDACGNNLLAVITENTDPVCVGDKIYTFTYTDCAGVQYVYTYTYLIGGFLSSPVVPLNVEEPLECVADIYTPVAPIVVDACGNNIIPVMTENVTPVCTGDKVYTFTYTDCSGLSSVYTYTFTINDNINPTASNLPAISVPGAIDVPVPNINDVFDEVDNCTTNPTVTFISDVSNGNVCNGEIITRTYAITDDCGNFILVTQQITIEAMTPPISVDDVNICEGNQVTLTADNPENAVISWDGGILDGVPFSPTQTSDYTVTAEDNGCFNTATSIVAVELAPVVAFMTTDSECEPFTVTLTNLSTAGSPLVDCQWDIEGAASSISGCQEVVYTFPAAGVYDVTLTTTSQTGCVNSATYVDFINVYEMPIASFTASSSTVSALNTEVDFTNTSTNAVSYEWMFGDGSPNSFSVDPTHEFPDDEDGDYIVTLVATSAIGCTDTATLAIGVDEELIFYVPNTFTPDGDEYNNSFHPVFTSGYDPFDYNLLIFNRWGEIVFESNDANFGWDGTYNGKMMQDGTYTWKIEFKQTINDKRVMVTGHVNIIR